MKTELSNRFYLCPESIADRKLIEKFITWSTIQNPEFKAAVKNGKQPYQRDKSGEWQRMPETLDFHREHKHEKFGRVYSFPVGFRRYYRAEIQDHTLHLPRVDFTFSGEPRNYQREAVRILLQERNGVLQAPTGAGKTFMGLAIIAGRKQPSLIVVHSRELLYQWIEAIEKHLQIPKKEVGIMGDGRREVGAKITVAIIDTLSDMLTEETRRKFGLIMVDECHRIASKTFSEAIDFFPARYKYGLSATPYRRDGLTSLIRFFIGKTLYTIKPTELQDRGHIMPVNLEVVETDFNFDFQDNYTSMIKALTKDKARNELIVSTIMSESQAEGVLLVVSDRKHHIEELRRQIPGEIPAAVLHGSTRKKLRKSIIEQARAGQIKILFSTVQLIGEGFDLPAISRIFMTTPIKFKGRVLQTIGRALRTSPGKGIPIIYDFLDKKIGILRASFHSRKKAYMEVGIAA